MIIVADETSYTAGWWVELVGEERTSGFLGRRYVDAIRADYGCVCDDPENFCGGADIDPDEDGYCAACAALDSEEHCLVCPFDCCAMDNYHPGHVVAAHDTEVRLIDGSGAPE